MRKGATRGGSRYTIACAWRWVFATLRINKHNGQELRGDQTGKRQCAQQVFHRLTSECVWGPPRPSPALFPNLGDGKSQTDLICYGTSFGKLCHWGDAALSVRRARVALHKWVRHHVTPIRPWAINVVKWGEEKVASDVTAQRHLPSCTECGVGLERGKARLSADAGIGVFRLVSNEARRLACCVSKNKTGKWR